MNRHKVLPFSAFNVFTANKKTIAFISEISRKIAKNMGLKSTIIHRPINAAKRDARMMSLIEDLNKG